MRRIPSFAAALFAGFMLALLPACGFSRFAHAGHAETGPIERPHIVRRVAPRDPDLPALVQRGAGENYGSDSWEDALSELLSSPVSESGRIVIALAAVAILGLFGLIWLLVELAQLAEDNDTNDHEAEQAEIAEKLRLASQQRSP